MIGLTQKQARKKIKEQFKNYCKRNNVESGDSQYIKWLENKCLTLYDTIGKLLPID